MRGRRHALRAQAAVRLWGASVAMLGLIPCAAQGQGAAPRPPGAEWTGAAFTFSRIADGVYHAVGTGALAVGANAVVIVNDSDVVLVDSHVSPAAAWALLTELKRITSRPVRTVINTHFHYDHAHGNEIYGADVQVIGHEVTRERLLAGASQQGAAYEGLLRVLPQRRDSLIRVLDTARAPAVTAALRERIGQVERYQVAIDAVHPTPPNVTLSRQLVLHRGAREIRVLFLGRGHTGGDVVVYLPTEKVVATGDLVGSGLPFLGDGYLDEWATTLRELDALDWSVLLPGHGGPVRDHSVPNKLASLLSDVHQQAGRLLEKGLTPDEVEAQLDLRSHVVDYPALADRTSADNLERFLLAVHRMATLRSGTRR